jgi:hypothetical protein
MSVKIIASNLDLLPKNDVNFKGLVSAPFEFLKKK